MDVVRFAREHRVRYEVAREASAAEVRVFATHEQGTLPAPGCPRCLELLRELQEFVARTLADARLAGAAQVAAEPDRLYQSTEEGVHDEVAVDVRLTAAPGADAPEAAVRAFTDRLDAASATRR